MLFEGFWVCALAVDEFAGVRFVLLFKFCFSSLVFLGSAGSLIGDEGEASRSVTFPEPVSFLLYHAFKEFHSPYWSFLFPLRYFFHDICLEDVVIGLWVERAVVRGEGLVKEEVVCLFVTAGVAWERACGQHYKYEGRFVSNSQTGYFPINAYNK